MKHAQGMFQGLFPNKMAEAEAMNLKAWYWGILVLVSWFIFTDVRTKFALVTPLFLASLVKTRLNCTHAMYIMNPQTKLMYIWSRLRSMSTSQVLTGKRSWAVFHNEAHLQICSFSEHAYKSEHKLWHLYICSSQTWYYAYLNHCDRSKQFHIHSKNKKCWLSNLFMHEHC